MDGSENLKENGYKGLQASGEFGTKLGLGHFISRSVLYCGGY
jgi:hypothetical protein